MRTIKPGKIGASPLVERRSKELLRDKGGEAVAGREVWDDFSAEKPGRQKKKKEYEKGAGNRMVPKTEPEKDEGAEAEVKQEESNYQPREDFEVLMAQFGYTFKDESLIRRALTHRSALGLKERADYERLEFLGDAVLDLSVADLLSVRHPDAREGELSKMRAALVNTQALAEIAGRLEVGPFIRLGRGELSSGGYERPSILADVMEAIIGAIYRDGVYEDALKTIEHIFGSALDRVTPYDPKTELQEALHSAGSEPPSYLLELVEGPEHAPTFVTVVVVDGEIVGRGKGPAKKVAQQVAAAEALSKLIFSSPRPELADEQDFLIADKLLVSDEALEAPAEESSAPDA